MHKLNIALSIHRFSFMVKKTARMFCATSRGRVEMCTQRHRRYLDNTVFRAIETRVFPIVSSRRDGKTGRGGRERETRVSYLMQRGAEYSRKQLVAIYAHGRAECTRKCIELRCDSTRCNEATSRRPAGRRAAAGAVSAEEETRRES